MKLKQTVSRLTALAVLAAAATTLYAQNQAVTVTVDAAPNRQAINPAIYGVAYATHGAAAGPERAAAPLRRQQHVALQLAAERRQSRRGLVLREHRASRAPRPASAATTSSTDSRAGNAEPMITVPIIEYVAKLGANRSQARELRQPRLRRRRTTATGSGSRRPATA